jgi:hypothetical protein
MMKRQAHVTLRQESIQRLFHGKAVTIRLVVPEPGEVELELRFDSQAQIGHSGSLEDLVSSMFPGRRN